MYRGPKACMSSSLGGKRSLNSKTGHDVPTSNKEPDTTPLPGSYVRERSTATAPRVTTSRVLTGSRTGVVFLSRLSLIGLSFPNQLASYESGMNA